MKVKTNLKAGTVTDNSLGALNPLKGPLGAIANFKV